MSLHSNDINAEACAWIARLHDAPPSNEELAALEAWMRQSPQHKAELVRMAERWEELNVLTELAVPFEDPGLRDADSRGSSALRFGTWRALAAVSVAAAAIFVALLWQPLTTQRGGESPEPHYVTAVGEQQLVTLPDYSTALLNTNSQLRVDYSGEFRDMYLIQGEAYFEVMPNPDKPFRVVAGNGLVWAVGTAFSVRLKDDTVEVTVTDGSVQIKPVKKISNAGMSSAESAGRSPSVVKAGQSAVFDQVIESVESIEYVDASEISRKLAWQDGLLKFSGERLEDVVKEVSRYTPLSIVITDSELREEPIGGFFEVGETEKMFEALETSFGVRVDRINDNLVHLSASADEGETP